MWRGPLLGLRYLSKQRPEHRAADSIVNNIPQYDPKHEAKLRSKVSVESMISVESLELEFRAEVAGTLGRIDRILVRKLNKMHEEEAALLAELSKPGRDLPKLKQLVDAFNKAQQEAYNARTDLICQRQSAGFEIDNAWMILNRYPIPSKKKLREE